jgi:hypothetical protein
MIYKDIAIERKEKTNNKNCCHWIFLDYNYYVLWFSIIIHIISILWHKKYNLEIKQFYLQQIIILAVSVVVV